MSAESDHPDDVPPDVFDAYREHALKWVRCPSCGATGEDEPGVTASVGIAESLSFACGRCGNALDLSAAIERGAAESDVLASLEDGEP